VKQIRLRTEKRTFLIEEGICKAVYLESRKHPEVGHLAVGKRFLGSVGNPYARVEEAVANPPCKGHYLAFAIQGRRKEGRLYSEATLVASEDVQAEPSSNRTPLPITAPSPVIKVTRKNTPPSTPSIRTSFN
jgi:hypothetical protein